MDAGLPNHVGPDDEEFMVVDPENTFWNRPELGPLERRVALTFEEGLFEEEIDTEAMEYWFKEPPGGWETGPKKLRKVPAEPWEYDTVDHPGEGRLALGQLREGEVLQGTVVKTMLYHGAQIDIGAEYDGMIPIRETEGWAPVMEDIDVGTSLEVKVYKIRDPSLFRFPIQLVPTDPQLAAKLADPSLWEAPMDLRECTLPLLELSRLSGREWQPKSWVLESEADRRRRNFEVEEELVWDQVSVKQLEMLDEVAQGLMG